MPKLVEVRPPIDWAYVVRAMDRAAVHESRNRTLAEWDKEERRRIESDMRHARFWRRLLG